MHYLIIDSHVLMKTSTVQQTYFRLEERLRPGFLKAILDYVASGSYCTNLEEVTPVFVFDWKDANRKYWRHYEYEKWLDTLEEKGSFVYVEVNGTKVRRKKAPYKYGRGFPSATDQKYYRAFYDAMSDRFTVGQKGFEADDMAGEIIRNLADTDTATLVTIDSDWLGLVKPGQVDFYNIIDYQPGNRHRKTLADVVNTTACRAYPGMTQPSDIWEYKSRDGDKSDRLLPGTPLGLISLLEPSSVPASVDLIEAKSNITDSSKCRQFLGSVGCMAFM